MGEVLMDHDLGSQHNGVPQRNPKQLLEKETLLLLFISLHLLLVFMFLCFLFQFCYHVPKAFFGKDKSLIFLRFVCCQKQSQVNLTSSRPLISPESRKKKITNKTKPQKRPPSNLSDKIF